MGKPGEQQKKNSKDALEDEARRAEAVGLRLSGMTYKEIGEEMGYSEVRAHAVVTKELAGVREDRNETINEVREVELARLDKLTFGVWTDATLGDDEKIKSVLKLMERRAKMLGLDAPKRIDTNVTKTPLSEASEEEIDALIAGDEDGED